MVLTEVFQPLWEQAWQVLERHHQWDQVQMAGEAAERLRVLKEILSAIYEKGGYGMDVDYSIASIVPRFRISAGAGG